MGKAMAAKEVVATGLMVSGVEEAAWPAALSAIKYVQKRCYTMQLN